MKRQWVSSVVTNESSWRWIWPASESQSARSRFVPSYEEAEVGPSWSCDHRWPLSSHLAPGHTFNNHTTEGNELLIHSEPAVPVTSAESVMWNIGVDWSGPRLSINQSINQSGCVWGLREPDGDTQRLKHSSNLKLVSSGNTLFLMLSNWSESKN